MLRHICSSVYPEIPGSRLPNSPTGDFDRQQFHAALCRFFRWTGAPWYPQGPCQSAERAAKQLHAAFLLPKVKRTYLVPLDRLALEDNTKRPPEDLRHIRFGKCEIIPLEDGEFAKYIPVDALRRFEARHWFEPEKYAGFHYLVVSQQEHAGAIYRRSKWGIFYEDLSAVGKIKLYEPVYPEPVEDALFIMLLCFLKDPSEAPEKPFAVPRVYSFTDDPFSEPSRAPNPSALSWTIAGDEEHEYEVPDRSNYFSFKAAEIENALGERWNRLDAVSNRSTEVGAKFSSLTKHFFVKVFADEGIDELVSGLTCVEATLMLREWKGRERMIEGCQNLLHNDTALNWLRDAYDLRDKYLHGLGDQGDTTAWEEVAKYRWAVAKAVDNYLTLAGTSSGEDRDTLLRLLKR
jgi:hypothetical protein